MKIDLILNDEEVSIEHDPLFPVLRFLREERGLSSLKTGCGEGECGACTILVGSLLNGSVKYRNVASCILPIGEVNGKHIVTLEGINGPGLSPVQQAMVDEGAVQCGFCTPGFVMSFTGFFLTADDYTKEKIIHAVDGNICRCTGYYAIKRAAEKMLLEIGEKVDPDQRIGSLAGLSVIPEYFSTIPERLERINRTHPVPGSNDHAGTGVRFVGGATDLLVGNRDGDPGNIVFISDIEGISDINSGEDHIGIGGGTTVEELKDSDVVHRFFPEIRDSMYLVSSQIIRNVATLGGNIVNASPIGDLSVLLLALDAVLEIRRPGRSRSVPLRDFFLGYKKMDLEPGEWIAKISIPVKYHERILSFEKVSRRNFLDIASCNSAALIHVNDGIIRECAISAGGVAPVPMFLKKSGSFAEGKELNPETIEGTITTAMKEVAPISDVRGSAEYKKELLGRLIRAHFTKDPASLKG